ncbi:MAG: adenylyl-sulfate kinase [Betaproteobacteria bacterium]|nr:adenylyl-sulfate kinase [Betaproteobacteria bacterium]
MSGIRTTGPVQWQNGKVARSDRERLLGQHAVTVWLTGLSGSGKTTLAFELERRLVQAGRACYVLDGDNVRHGLTADLGFSPADRSENIRRVAEVANLMNDAGLIVITAFISPSVTDRARARAVIGNDRFLEVFLAADLAVCEARDPKGLYARARAGQIPEFTGVSAPYDVPEFPDLLLSTGRDSVDHCVDEVMRLMTDRLWLSGPSDRR